MHEHLIHVSLPKLWYHCHHDTICCRTSAQSDAVCVFQGSLAVATQMLMSEEAYGVPGLRAALGRLANSVVAVLGPELSPGTDVYTKCKALIREVQVGLHNIRLLPWQSMLALSKMLNVVTRSTVMLSSFNLEMYICSQKCPPNSKLKLRNALGTVKTCFYIGEMF